MSRSKQVNFRCPTDIAELFEKSAKETGLSLGTWLIVVGLEAAGHGELRAQLVRVAARPVKKAKKVR